MATNDEDPKKYVVLENILININSKVIALQDTEIKRNNIILTVRRSVVTNLVPFVQAISENMEQGFEICTVYTDFSKAFDKVTDMIIDKMKQKDVLFAGFYKEKFYGGSFYDNLKVGNPNEFDLDLILNIPVITEPTVNCTDQPGFVQIEIKEYMKILERPEEEKKKFEKLNALLDYANFLSTDKVLQWMEGVINKSINELAKDERGTYVDAVLDRSEPKEVTRIHVRMSKGAPAFTLRISGKDIDDSDIQLDIDLVPCFQFHKKNWPSTSGGYRPNPSTNKERFLVVPKKPREIHLTNSPVKQRYWRLSFQEQERELISGGNKKVLKPVLKLLKKLRDKHNHKIASYFIKTIFLWEVEAESVSFWSQSLSVVFMTMLKKYAEHMRNQNISYYWNEKYNLIGYLKDQTKSDIANTLYHIIEDVEKNLDTDPFVIGKYLLSKEAYENLRSEVKLSKKQEKKLVFSSSKSLVNTLSTDVPDSGPPLRNLGFDEHEIRILRQYSCTFEENKQQFVNDIMAQINGTNNSSTNYNAVISYLKRIDEKMDKIMDVFDKLLEENKKTNERVATLEEQFQKLDMENRELKNAISKANAR